MEDYAWVLARNDWVVPFPEIGLTWRRVQGGWQEENYYFGRVRFETSLRHPSGESKEVARCIYNPGAQGWSNKCRSHLQTSVPFSPFPLPS